MDSSALRASGSLGTDKRLAPLADPGSHNEIRGISEEVNIRSK